MINARTYNCELLALDFIASCNNFMQILDSWKPGFGSLDVEGATVLRSEGTAFGNDFGLHCSWLCTGGRAGFS